MLPYKSGIMISIWLISGWTLKIKKKNIFKLKIKKSNESFLRVSIFVNMGRSPKFWSFIFRFFWWFLTPICYFLRTTHFSSYIIQNCLHNFYYNFFFFLENTIKFYLFDSSSFYQCDVAVFMFSYSHRFK